MFSTKRLKISKCTLIKCLLETNFASSVKPRNVKCCIGCTRLFFLLDSIIVSLFLLVFLFFWCVLSLMLCSYQCNEQLLRRQQNYTRLWHLFTNENSDFGTISLTRRSCVTPILNIEQVLFHTLVCSPGTCQALNMWSCHTKITTFKALSFIKAKTIFLGKHFNNYISC